MRQAIITKYLGATNYRGARVKATAAGRATITIPWDDALDVDPNHAAAARALALRMGWLGVWVVGGANVGNVYVNIGPIAASIPSATLAFVVEPEPATAQVSR